VKVLVIAAHADDEVYGAGGSIAKHSFFFNDEVYVCVLTDSVTAQYKDNIEKRILLRKEEAQKAAKILNIKDLFFFDLPDMQLDTISHIKINECIKTCVDRIKPQIIYTHHFADINKDHRLAFESTVVVARKSSFIKKILTYLISYQSDLFMPNVFVDISEYLQVKIEAIKAYKSELRKFPHPRSIESVTRQAKYTGAMIGKESAEGFMLIREII
jgi:LmbE family N-acetylglucosaminyl deacetylase